MEDLANQAPGTELTGADFNQPMNEIQNVITTAGQSLSAGDVSQLVKGIATYVASGNFYTDSGAANAYTLTGISTLQSVQAYLNGLVITFVAANVNTGASTVNVALIGAVDLVDAAGVALTGGEVSAIAPTQAYFNQGSNHFRIFGVTDVSSDDVTNDSGVTGATVTAALNTLNTGISPVQIAEKTSALFVNNSTAFVEDVDLRVTGLTPASVYEVQVEMRGFFSTGGAKFFVGTDVGNSPLHLGYTHSTVDQATNFTQNVGMTKLHIPVSTDPVDIAAVTPTEDWFCVVTGHITLPAGASRISVFFSQFVSDVANSALSGGSMRVRQIA